MADHHSERGAELEQWDDRVHGRLLSGVFFMGSSGFLSAQKPCGISLPSGKGDHRAFSQGVIGGFGRSQAPENPTPLGAAADQAGRAGALADVLHTFRTEPRLHHLPGRDPLVDLRRHDHLAPRAWGALTRHMADTPSPILLKHLLKGRTGVEQPQLMFGPRRSDWRRTPPGLACGLSAPTWSRCPAGPARGCTTRRSRPAVARARSARPYRPTG